MAKLVPRLKTLTRAAKAVLLGFSIDAEEADPLALPLSFIGAVLVDPDLAGWDGVGVIVQAYGPRAGGIIDHLYELAKRHNRQITIRLVKGAYWDSEIKQAQIHGLDGFPVFTTKAVTDICYIANTHKVRPQYKAYFLA
jgi:RHH-type proline utilization regulon transcriptional repressor/proline dehydrogenase/delta 1-pyrroline-5-carboxylate dehydrogenase